MFNGATPTRRGLLQSAFSGLNLVGLKLPKHPSSKRGRRLRLHYWRALLPPFFLSPPHLFLRCPLEFAKLIVSIISNGEHPTVRSQSLSGLPVNDDPVKIYQQLFQVFASVRFLRVSDLGDDERRKLGFSRGC